jgi:drug/metabolite transporter (DMT)-like permease
VLAVVALGAAVLLAVGYVLQQHEAAQSDDHRLSPRLLLTLARRPAWLGGIGAMVAGQLLGALALGMGSLVVVEPLLAVNVLFALPLGAVASRRWLSAGDWAGAAMLVAGVGIFLLGVGSSEAVHRRDPGAWGWSLTGGSVLLVVATLLAVARGRQVRSRAALLATAAGAVFGMQDVLTQRTVLVVDEGWRALVGSWQPWVLIVVAIAGLTFAQNAFGLADISASLPAITLAEPVVGMAVSAGALGQGLPTRPLLLAAALGGLCLMLAGVVLLTRSPLVVDPHGSRLRHPSLPRHLPRHLPHRREHAPGGPR